MVKYDILEDFSAAGLFLTHRRVSAGVRAYSKCLRLSKWLDLVSRVFDLNGIQSSKMSPTNKFPGAMDKGVIKDFQATCSDDSVKEMFCCAKSCQRDAVQKWNPDADEPTHSNHSGLIVIDEGAYKECGALALDLLIKFGIMMKSKDSSYDVPPDFEAKRAYLFGDVKTVDNVDKFVNTLSK